MHTVTASTILYGCGTGKNYRMHFFVSAQLGRISRIVGLNMPHTTNDAHHKRLHLCEVSNQCVNTTRPTRFASDVAMNQ